MKILNEIKDEDLFELLGFLKGKYKSIKEIKNSSEFKKLSDSEQEFIIDELKDDKFKESIENYNMESTPENKELADMELANITLGTPVPEKEIEDFKEQKSIKNILFWYAKK